MASSSLQQGNGHLMFKYNSPYFYKIILQDSIQKGKLGIPRKFVENHGNDMSSPAMLRVPSGEVWKVELSKCDGKILLENGWLEFSKHYFLELGYLLVFRYDGNNNFHVVIFNRSASEIQYPCTSNNHRRPQSIDGSEDDDSKQIQKSQLSCPRQGKMMRSTNSATKTETGCFWKSGSLAPPTNSDKSTSHNGITISKSVMFAPSS
ncbi:hypothetical protein HRI_000478900 [Hibiscus trionum]|uniref:TF-B3 domain-containing protein n=1 Tax=Hibiscus trionum TaxID=183268 RepID=A0A9W7H1K5_HIBTR|nr:hypothetical protein HRI_000478900 [Hibiscus trionum]